MKIRRYTPLDAEAVDDIYNRCHGHFNLPSIRRCIELAVVESKDKVIALGALQVIPELVLVLDNQQPIKREQVGALRLLLDAGETIARLHEFSEVYAFPDTDKYGEILKKHFNFKDGNHILIKRLDDGE